MKSEVQALAPTLAVAGSRTNASTLARIRVSESCREAMRLITAEAPAATRAAFTSSLSGECLVTVLKIMSISSRSMSRAVACRRISCVVAVEKAIAASSFVPAMTEVLKATSASAHDLVASSRRTSYRSVASAFLSAWRSFRSDRKINHETAAAAAAPTSVASTVDQNSFAFQPSRLRRSSSIECAMSEREPTSRTVSVNEARGYACEFCSAVFITEATLNGHRVTVHGVDPDEGDAA